MRGGGSPPKFLLNEILNEMSKKIYTEVFPIYNPTICILLVSRDPMKKGSRELSGVLGLGTATWVYFGWKRIQNHLAGYFSNLSWDLNLLPLPLNKKHSTKLLTIVYGFSGSYGTMLAMSHTWPHSSSLGKGLHTHTSTLTIIDPLRKLVTNF